ncbi:MerR family transcriptional regulator [Pectinatus sottacetonis]|uniref:MerR family transcriptional regulator n=1 Tax=Pectinatus sottacetonis TaxID=1002795 RepID=UPI0018C6A1B4|nr:MerR family transcriptional regulator [Pectinatus sottacetonis]
MFISQISKITGICESTLRYYEKKKLIRVTRNKNGCRDYSENDIEWILFIKRLKDTGMLLRDIQTYAKLRYQGDATMRARLNLLLKHRHYVLKKQRQWLDYLNNLDAKIKIYKVKLKKAPIKVQ